MSFFSCSGCFLYFALFCRFLSVLFPQFTDVGKPMHPLFVLFFSFLFSISSVLVYQKRYTLNTFWFILFCMVKPIKVSDDSWTILKALSFESGKPMKQLLDDILTAINPKEMRNYTLKYNFRRSMLPELAERCYWTCYFNDDIRALGEGAVVKCAVSFFDEEFVHNHRDDWIKKLRSSSSLPKGPVYDYARKVRSADFKARFEKRLKQ